MTNYTKLYWLTRLDSIQGLLAALITFGVVAMVVYFAIPEIKEFDWSDDEMEAYKKKNRWTARASIWLILISCLLKTFLPTRNDAIIIMAGGKAMDYVQSDTSISKLPYQTTLIISEYLDKTLKQLKEDK